MRWCIFCGVQVSDGVRGATRLSASLSAAFGQQGRRMVIPVAESAMPDETEHLAVEHGFAPKSSNMVNGKVVEQGSWVCIRQDDDHEFAEVWFRTGSRTGKPA